MAKHYLHILFLLVSASCYGQNLRQLLNTYTSGVASEKVRAADELMDYYIGENKDTLEVLGEELFYYGIENHYFPAIETGKIILAEFYVETGKTADGITMAKSLLPAMEERGDYEKLSKVSKLICQGYRFDKDASSAMYWAEQAVKYSKKSDDPEVQTYGYLSLAESFVLNKKPKTAISYFKEYIKKARPLKLDRGICAAYARLGDLYRLQGNLDQAEFYFNASYRLAKKINRKTSLGHALNNLAIVYFERGDTLKARSYFEKGLQLRMDNKDVNAIAESYYNLGDYQFYIGKPQLAIRWYKKSYDHSREHNLLPQAKDALYVLAQAYKNINQLDEANKYLEKYIDVEEQMNSKHQKNEQKIKEKQLEFLKLELEAEQEGYEIDKSFIDYIKPEWILIALLGLFSLFLSIRLRKQSKN